MKKKTLVFSLVKHQSIFMTVIVSILTFLSVLVFGIALSVGTGVIKWNNQWNRYATVQISKPDNVKHVKKIFENNADKIESVNEISKPEMEKMMKQWVSSGANLNNYLPQMFEVKFKNTSAMETIGREISTHAKFLTHTSALKTSINAGWKLVGITLCILILILTSIGMCISYISKNIAMLHKHELEILNQVGASDKFVAKQMQIIVGKICTIACIIGFISAVPIIFAILWAARSARVGLLATLSLTGFDWSLLAILPILIIIFSVYITKRTTLKLLSTNL